MGGPTVRSRRCTGPLRARHARRRHKRVRTVRSAQCSASRTCDARMKSRSQLAGLALALPCFRHIGPMLVSRAPRLALVDALRGFAVAQMIVYHFIYDLDYFGWVDLVMTRDQPWLGWRTAIVTQFLLLVGLSLVLRTSFKPSAGDFWKRWAQVAGPALLV